MTEAELLALKGIITPAVLAISGVTGLGIGAEGFRVYLAADDESVRGLVEGVVRRVNAQVPIEFVTTGSFRASPKRDS
jgi:hypothetical protein